MKLKKLRQKAWFGIKRAFYYDTRPTEFLSIGCLLWWAIILSARATFIISPSFTYIARISSEPGWSMACFFLALLHIAGLVFNWYEMRRLACFLTSFFWVCVAVLMVMASPYTTGTGIYAIIAVSMLWVFWRGPHNRHIIYIGQDESGKEIKRVL